MSATDVTTPKAPPWSPDDLFQPDHPGSCCTCCEGDYCPISDEHVGQLYTVGVGDTLMISDRRVAIRGDMVAADPGWPIVPAPRDPGWTDPDSRPTETRMLFTPSIAGRLLRLGIHIGHSDEFPQPLYLGDQHIGWVMHAWRGSTLTEVRRLLELSKERGTEGNARYLWGAGVDEDRLDAMAEALRWAREVGI